MTDDYLIVDRLLARLSHAVGQYVECDERPRPTSLWAAMCDAQQAAAVFINTGIEVGGE